MNLAHAQLPTSQPRGNHYWQPFEHSEVHSTPSSSPRGETFSSNSDVNSLGSASLTSYSSGSVGDSPHGTSAPSYCGHYQQTPHQMMATQSYGAPPPHGGYLDHHAPASAPSYAHYGQHSGPLLPPTPMHSYPQQYTTYAYAPQPVSTAAAHHSQYGPPQLPPTMLPPTMPSNQPNSNPVPYGTPHTPDTTGQVAPPNAKPKLTGTVWEDEGTVCFQVEVRGICVARREDNCFINGTKLLNVANMTRGRRDGILKSEKIKNVVKIGPMHLKGVWIPFERALEFANKEKITEQLYPLFVSNISPLLAPQFQNQLPSGRRTNQSQSGAVAPGAPPAVHPSNVRTPQQQNQPAPTSSSPTATNGAPTSAGRPEMSRSHTFPTPPASATSATGQNTSGSYGWDQSQQHNLHLDTGLHNTKSMPTTPTTTPPDGHHYGAQTYDARYSQHYMPQQSYNSHMAPPKKEEDDRKDHTYGSYSYTDPHASQTSPGRNSYAPVDPSRQDNSGWTNGNYSSHRSVPSSNLAYVVNDNSSSGNDAYTYTNGVTQMPSKKRGRDDDGEIDHPQKRKMTIHENGVDARPHHALVQRS